MRRLMRRPHRDEKGVVVVLMAAFVMGIVGMAALVVDVGTVLDEKRQLQTGADAAALGLAQHLGRTCPVTATAACTASLQSRADELAKANARDGFAKVEAPTSDHTTRQVTVRTSTLDGGTGTILPYSFGQALTGVEGKTVHASATASWGPVGRAPVMRLAILQCDFVRLGFSTVESTIVFHSESACGGGPGLDAPGNFGWLEDDSDGDACELTVSANQVAGGRPGNSPALADCVGAYLNEDILLPVSDDIVGVTGPGGNAVYTVKGFARFHLTAYRFGPKGSPGPDPCSGATNCIKGYFVRYVMPSGVIGGTEFGVSTVKLVS